jgi:two-component system, NtrC family, response regulator HydG
LIVDDDVSFSLTLKAFLERQGFAVDEAYTAHKAQEKFSGKKFDIILTDFRLPDYDGLQLLKMIKEKTPASLVILMTAYADIRMAVRAIKHGAYEYVAKPVNPDELLVHINSGLKKQSEQSGKKAMPGKPAASRSIPVEYLETSSDASQGLHEHIRLVASTDLSVIIQGRVAQGRNTLPVRFMKKVTAAICHLWRLIAVPYRGNWLAANFSGT